MQATRFVDLPDNLPAEFVRFLLVESNAKSPCCRAGVIVVNYVN